MRLYDGGRAPNPRRVRIFLAEKGIQIPLESVDLGTMAHKSSAYASVNPLQRVPALELDDGTILTETMAICRYFEALYPEPPLFGVGALDQAMVEMWNRRLELELMYSVMHVFRHLHPGMKQMQVPQVPEWGEANKPRVFEMLEVLDRQLSRHRYAAGDRLSVADITGMVAVDFMKPAKLAVPDSAGHVKRWYAEMTARPSAAA